MFFHLDYFLFYALLDIDPLRWKLIFAKTNLVQLVILSGSTWDKLFQIGLATGQQIC